MIAKTTLRPYQADAIASARNAYAQGARRVLEVLPTGTGKTVIFAECIRLALARGRRSLVLAHRTELLGQAAKKLEDLGIVATLEKAGSRGGGNVVVASVQTLKGKRLEGWPADYFGFIVVDEAHHTAAKGYRDILQHFSGAHVLGVTATPDRLDGVALGGVYEVCAFKLELRQAIRDGWLVPIRAKRVTLERVDFTPIATRLGDLAQDQLAQVMNAEHALHGVAVPLLEQSADRPTIVFTVDVPQAHALAEIVNRYQPGEARALDGTADEGLRKTTLRDFEAGRFRILFNCALFTEGFDMPIVSCVGIARPTKSRALYTQMIGRGTRLHPSKTDCLVLDFTGMAGRHRLVNPADVLAGDDLDDTIRALVEAKLGQGEVDLEAELAYHEAAETLRKQQEELAVRAIATYQAQEVDPFLEDVPTITQYEEGPEATPDQLERLAKRGIERPPKNLTRARAAWWLDALRVRSAKGLCTLKQARWLAKLGHPDAKNLRFEEANEILGKVRGVPFMQARQAVFEHVSANAGGVT